MAIDVKAVVRDHQALLAADTSRAGLAAAGDETAIQAIVEEALRLHIPRMIDAGGRQVQFVGRSSDARNMEVYLPGVSRGALKRALAKIPDIVVTEPEEECYDWFYVIANFEVPE